MKRQIQSDPPPQVARRCTRQHRACTSAQDGWLDAGRMSLRRKLFWVSVLYFAEGFPFGIAVDNLPVYFRVHGVSLTEIGLMSLLGMPWTLKVLWSPLVDRFGTRQQWIVSCLLIMAVVLM